MKYTTRCNVSKLCFMCYKFTKGCMMLMFMKCSANVKAKHQGCYTLGDEAEVEARFGLSDIVLILTQDRCMVCVECTIGTGIVLDAPDGTPR